MFDLEAIKKQRNLEAATLARWVLAGNEESRLMIANNLTPAAIVAICEALVDVCPRREE